MDAGISTYTFAVKNKIMKFLYFILAGSITLSACKKETKSDHTETANTNASGGKITLTINGNTYTSVNGVNALILDGKFMGCTDSKTSGGFDYKIGDSEEMDLTEGTTKKIAILVYPDGISYGAARYFSPGVSLTITHYDGKTLKGTFSGEVTLDGDNLNPNVPVNGTIETNDLLIL